MQHIREHQKNMHSAFFGVHINFGQEPASLLYSGFVAVASYGAFKLSQYSHNISSSDIIYYFVFGYHSALVFRLENIPELCILRHGNTGNYFRYFGSLKASVEYINVPFRTLFRYFLRRYAVVKGDSEML